LEGEGECVRVYSKPRRLTRKEKEEEGGKNKTFDKNVKPREASRVYSVRNVQDAPSSGCMLSHGWPTFLKIIPSNNTLLRGAPPAPGTGFAGKTSPVMSERCMCVTRGLSTQDAPLQVGAPFCDASSP
jgi:hypothetical protein